MRAHLPSRRRLPFDYVVCAEFRANVSNVRATVPELEGRRFGQQS